MEGTDCRINSMRFLKTIFRRLFPKWASPYQCYWRDRALNAESRISRLENALLSGDQYQRVSMEFANLGHIATKWGKEFQEAEKLRKEYEVKFE